jgi:hypothetical protein
VDDRDSMMRRGRLVTGPTLMGDNLFLTLASAGFGIAFLHAALPTHWLPFALTARARRWSRAKTAWVTLSASAAHVTFTIAIGAALFAGGRKLSESTHEIFNLVAGGILVLLGLWFVSRQALGKSHGHSHLLGRHADEIHDHEYDMHCIEREEKERKSSRLTVGALVLMVTLSPCESFLPIFVSGSSYGWSGFLILSLVLLVATAGAMTTFTMVARYSIDHMRIGLLEKYENGILGAVLMILGTIFMVWGH